MVTDVVCTFCGTLCDDIEVLVEGGRIKEVRHACVMGSAKLLRSDKRVTRPSIRENGRFREVDVEEAAEEAARILVEAKRPLLWGWASTDCGAQRVGVALAEEVGGVIDSTASVCHGPSCIAVQDVGMSSATLGQIKNRADLVVYWGANPMHAHPRHLSRYSIFPRGYFRERGEQDRKLIVIDTRQNDTSKIADRFVQIGPGCDYELLGALRTIVNGGEITQKEIGGVPATEIRKLAEEMMGCQFGTIFFGLGLTMSPGRHRNIDNAISLVADLNRHTKFVIMPMRGHYNVVGFSEVLTWQTGYPFAVDFSRGYPRYNPGETTANDLLQRGEADAMLSIASDPVANFPGVSVKHISRIPLIVIDPHVTPTTQLADVIFPSAIVGIEAEGTAYRMDNVPIRARKIIEPPEGVLPDEEIIELILKKVKEVR